MNPSWRNDCHVNAYNKRYITNSLWLLQTHQSVAESDKNVFIQHLFLECGSLICFLIGHKLRRSFKTVKYDYNKVNLRDLIVATGLVILLKLDLNRRFFSPCDLEIWWMTPPKNRAPLLCYFKLFAAFRSHWWIQTGVTVRKRLIWVKIDAFLAVWPWNLTDDLQKQ